MENPLKKLEERKKLRIEKINQARASYVAWFEISNTTGWKVYSEEIDKKIDLIRKQMEEDSSLNGDDLKKLQLALSIWKTVKNLPKQIEQRAKGESNG